MARNTESLQPGDIVEVISGRYVKKDGQQRGKVIKATAQMVELDLIPVAMKRRGPVRTTRLMQSCVRKVTSVVQAEVPSEVVREGYQPGDAVEIIGGKYYSATKTRYATVVTESEWMVKVRLNWVNAGEVRTPTLMKGNLKRVVTQDEEEESVSASESSAGTDSVTLGLDDVAGVAPHAARRTGGEGGR